MAIREYIGARYVPRFVGTHDPTQIYDALDVVDNGSGTSYIARRTVPAGTALTDTTYWFVYGAASGAILALQNRMSAAEQDIIDINEEMDIMRHGDIICVSDSYGHYPSTTDNWIDKLAASIPNTVYKAEIGGAAFSSPTIPFTYVITSIENQVTDPDKVGAVIVGGGRNEYLNPTNIGAGMQNFATYVKMHYPNAKIYVFFIGLDKAIANMNTLVSDCIPAYKVYANLYEKNMSFVTNSEKILRNYNHLDSGGVHPNTTGAGDIARAVKNFLLNGQPLITNNIDYDQSIVSSGPHDTAYTDKTLRCSGCGDVVDFWITSSFGLTYSTPNAGNAWVELGHFTPGLINGLSYWRSRVPIPCQVRINNEQVTACGWLGFQDGKLYFNLGVSSTIEYDRLTINSASGRIPLTYA